MQLNVFSLLFISLQGLIEQQGLQRTLRVSCFCYRYRFVSGHCNSYRIAVISKYKSLYSHAVLSVFVNPITYAHSDGAQGSQIRDENDTHNISSCVIVGHSTLERSWFRQQVGQVTTMGCHITIRSLTEVYNADFALSLAVISGQST